MKFTTPLRYPGGKAKLTDFFKIIINLNEMIGCHYVEPYAGGAGIALNLLFHNYASHIHLNDLNAGVYSFWKSVTEQTDELCKLIFDTPVNIDEWHYQKKIQIEKNNNISALELGFSTFFLNRTNRSGIIKGGVIGGKSQEGPWKIDARFNKLDLISRIEKIALFRDKISIYNYDAASFLKNIIPDLVDNTLLYLDPPYYNKGQQLYENHYSHEDHINISNIITSEIRKPWIVSYDHVDKISDMYMNSRSIVYGLNYSAQKRYEGAEIMFFSDCFLIPDIKNPINLKIA